MVTETHIELRTSSELGMVQENLEMSMKILKAGFGSGETIREENVFLVFFIATKQKNLIFFLFFPLLFPRYRQS